MEQLTHFKKLLNPKYLGSHDLEPDKEYPVIIERYNKEEVIGDAGKKSDKTICYFKGGQKGLILNATNLKMMSKVLGSKYIEHWIGKTVILKVVQEKAFGETMDVIRVLNKKV